MKVLFHHLMEPVSVDLAGITGPPTLVIQTATSVIVIAVVPLLGLFYNVRGSHDGSAFLAIDEATEVHVQVGAWFPSRLVSDNLLDVIKSLL
jgi:hypothetical protein